MVSSLLKGEDVLIVNKGEKRIMKYTIDKAREIFADCGYELISDVYVNVNTPLKYICMKHRDKGIQSITMKAFKSGQRCVYCKYESGESCNFRLPDDIYQQETEKRGYLFKGVHSEKGSIMIDFVCNKHPDYGTQSVPFHYLKANKCSCKVCNGVDRNTDDFDKMVKEKFPHIDVIGEYSGTRKRVKVKCNIDNYEWEPFAYNLLSGCGCPVCHHKKIGDLKRIFQEDKLEKLQLIHPDIQFLEIPNLARENVHCKCKECGAEWYASYDNLTKSKNPTGCPRCSESRGEKRIHEILECWGYSFTPQKRFQDLRDINLLPFDVYLDDFNVIIEFDGIQHYKLIEFGGISKEKAVELHNIIKKHDNIKNKYCEKHNIPLIRIPYWELDDIEYVLFDELVKLNVIIEL